MDFNDIEQRVNSLYSSIEITQQLFNKKLQPKKTVAIDENVTKTTQLSYGGEKLSGDEKNRVISQITNIISKIANFKDNLINKLNKQIVYDGINNSLALQIIIDLDNQDKQDIH